MGAKLGELSLFCRFYFHINQEMLSVEAFKGHHHSQCAKTSLLIPKNVVFVCFKPNFPSILLRKKTSSQDFKTRLVRVFQNSTRLGNFRVGSNSVPALRKTLDSVTLAQSGATQLVGKGIEPGLPIWNNTFQIC